MARRRASVPLDVYHGARRAGRLEKAASGAITFRYDGGYVDENDAVPVSLSLPLRERRYAGATVANVFENLLPDAEPIRRRVAERVGAAGTDAHALLAAIGRDCVGALQFLPADESPTPPGRLDGEPLDDAGVAAMLATLASAPLGLDRERDAAFRISIAGAQEKTALLRDGDRWLRPHGTTPTTHILKPPIGRLADGTDLSDSVENEFYCLRLLDAFGLPVARAEIGHFEDAKALVVERFDRRRDAADHIRRLSQEDCCQALGVPPTRKYQSDGGPGIVDIAALLQGSDDPEEDWHVFFTAQLLYWLIGATDGHAKNFGLFLLPRGRFRMTPLYDVLSLQPHVDRGEVRRNAFRLSMAVGERRHYRVHDVLARHFEQSAKLSRMPPVIAERALERVVDGLARAFDEVEAGLPKGFPERLHTSVGEAARKRARRLRPS